MALIIKKWFPRTSERRLLEHLSSLYSNAEQDVYLLHDVLLATKEGERFRPDFIIVDPDRGIAIVEEKSYVKENLLEIDERVHFRNGESDVNPIRKGEDYKHNLLNLLAAEGIKIQASDISCHLVFSNLPNKYLNEYPSHFVQKHYKNYQESLSLESLFGESFRPIKQVKKISHILAPVLSFESQLEMEEHRESIAQLDEKQLDVVLQNPFGHYLVSGIPGSGKSVVVVSRALFLQELYPDWRILILSVNEKLKAKNEEQVKGRRKLQRSLSLQNNIHCKTLMGFLRENGTPSYERLSYPEQIRSYIDQISNKEVFPEWDAILIDEYQDFEDETLELILRFAKKMEMTINRKEVVRENLFLVGDKLQQIWEDGCSHSWISMGIHVVGRSTILKTSYRCGKSGLTLGLELLKSCSPGLRSQVEKFYEGTDDIDFLLKNDHPITFSHAPWENAEFALKKWLLGLISEGATYTEIIVIVPDSHKKLSEMQASFRKEIDQGLTIGMPSTLKGLEAPFCAIYNLDFIKPVKWHSREVHYKTIYMCLTRASYGLFINSFQANDETFQKLIEIDSGTKEDKLKIAR